MCATSCALEPLCPRASVPSSLCALETLNPRPKRSKGGLGAFDVTQGLTDHSGIPCTSCEHFCVHYLHVNLTNTPCMHYLHALLADTTCTHFSQTLLACVTCTR